MKRLIVMAILVGTIPVLPRAADIALLEAIRSATAQSVRDLLRSGADPNVRDATGATPLMYASIYGSLDDMRLLLDHKADVNAVSDSGATALMWAAHDPARVRLLLERGAAFDTRTTGRTVTTPLIAAIRSGNAASVKTLIDHGADPKRDATTLVAEVYTHGNAEVERALAAAGVPVHDHGELSKILATGEIMVNVGFAERLIRHGATPPLDYQARIFKAPLLGFAVHEFGVPLTRVLLDGGADPNRLGSGGVTSLMMAAAAPEPDPRAIQLLLDRGADLSARDERGRTALDWALLQGETAVARHLRKAGALASATMEPAPVPVAVPRTPKAAVETALAQLQPADVRFSERAGCVSCHHQTLPSIAVSLARKRGAKVLPMRQGGEATLALWGPRRDELLLGRITGIGIGGFVGTAAYALAGLAEEGTPPNLLTDALALALAARQQADGSWNVGDIRPPLFDVSPVHFTALAVRGLQEYMPRGRHSELDARTARARQVLQKAEPRHTQDEAFKLLGLVWSRAASREIVRQRDRIVALQRKDGGWGQRSTMAPDAYQTGQVLYALQASGVNPSNLAFRRGVDYLLRTQLEDGTWFVPSRGFAFQPHIETGFPHGSNQFISAAATAWATIALTFAM